MSQERIWHPRSSNSTAAVNEDNEDNEASGSTGPTGPTGSTSTYTVNIHNPAVTYGGLNPEIEEHVLIVKTVPDHDLRYGTADRRKMLGPDLDEDLGIPLQRRSTSAASRDLSPAPSSLSRNPDICPILNLPPELIDAIFSWLAPLELATVSRVCRSLRNHANSDTQWRRHVLSNLPVNRISSPYPCQSWRELYISHDPYWFLTKHKLWFCDRELTGQIIIIRYDERRGCIEGYQMLATRNRDGSEPWGADQAVHIHYFEPTVKLHLDKPVLQLDVPSSSLRHSFSEQPMRIHSGTDPRFSNFLLAKPLSKSALDGRMTEDFPYGYVWPPPTIPARHRVTGQPTGVHPLATSVNYTRSTSAMWQPHNRSEASDQTFRIRRWMEMGPPTLGVHAAEELVTYSTLDPILYTPTAEKPWRGIWVGDYSGHGCEFLLINQPDDEMGHMPLERLQGETDSEFEQRFRHERVYRGRLEAVKLTGDVNVPRGEFTFVADDLGDNGMLGTAKQPPFEGARVVRSKGHIAHMGFSNDRYIESQLLLLSYNRLAQYWVGFGHISFFERVDIDQFLVPK
ncbi:uncharacterized protein F4812DRAFT_443436 [Daldinia caldariorum]|uniref:uncharacterized protein n=1 Tax=Daldinia caldariorum TaxID=326644 RepID=UPI0020083008|nr:uncharacterized protein F4812DRAFT_443436 [Daldinia caldariorum]KAI1464122.1 hypothetical protein F4812DRAFT_443436 [Daldinia caldariorum]